MSCSAAVDAILAELYLWCNILCVTYSVVTSQLRQRPVHPAESALYTPPLWSSGFVLLYHFSVTSYQPSLTISVIKLARWLMKANEWVYFVIKNQCHSSFIYVHKQDQHISCHLYTLKNAPNFNLPTHNLI